MLGGITRLSGSGLSITEWDVVTGTLPPFSHQQWLDEFAKYRQTPQFQYLNHSFTLTDFKSIFFWEWFHRLWARLMGVVFLIPFIVFIARKQFSRKMIRPMLILFLLGALQGAIGWIMVASGLTGDAVYVKPMKLALHFLFAMMLLAYTFWFALRLLFPGNSNNAAGPRRHWIILLIFLLGIQFFYGALMAGHKAAVAAATWPSINGQFFPAALSADHEILSNPLWIHFIHRGLAYLLTAGVIILSACLFRLAASSMLRRAWWIPLAFVVVQVVLGIVTVVSSTGIEVNHWGSFHWIAALHQLVAMLLLLSLLAVYFFSGTERNIVVEDGPPLGGMILKTNLSNIN